MQAREEVEHVETLLLLKLPLHQPLLSIYISGGAASNVSTAMLLRPVWINSFKARDASREHPKHDSDEAILT